METLNTVAMTRSAHATVQAPSSNGRAKSGPHPCVLDACLRMLARIVHCKTDWSGTTLVQVDTWFPNSKLCSECEAKNTQL